MPDKENYWNSWIFYLTLILLFFTIYTVLKDAITTNLILVIYALIGSLILTWFVTFLIRNQIDDNYSITDSFNNYRAAKQLYMFDITDEHTREKKIKFIETLLIVGGIIGGLSLQNVDDWRNIILGFFLLASLIYFFPVFNFKENSTPKSIAIIIGSFLTSVFFSLLAIIPLLSKTIFSMMLPVNVIIYIVLIIFLFLALVYLIFITLFL